MRESFSSLDHVVGGPPIVKELAKLVAAKKFESQEFRVEDETKMTPEQLSVIQLVNAATDVLRERYGLEAFPIPLQNIHVIRREKWKLKIGGISKTDSQAIFLPESRSLSEFAHVIIHEMLHVKSLDVWKISSEDASPKIFTAEVKESNAPEEQPRKFYGTDYRSGIAVNNRQKGKTFFGLINEAVTEQLTKQVWIELRTQPPLLAEWNQTKALVPKDRNPDQFVYIEKAGDRIQGDTLVYKRERRALNTILEKVVEKNPDTTKEELFDSFVQLFFTGNAGTSTQIFDKTFGAGTYRKIAACNHDIDALEKLISEL